MKEKLFAAMLMVAVLTACSNDEDSYTEYWNVTIEPEYVLSGSGWGAYTPVFPHMEARDENGKLIGHFGMDEIKGFTYEEGYRYQLRLKVTDSFKKTGQYIADASQYDFKLAGIISKEYVGIREEGRREVEMDVELARIRSTHPEDSWEYTRLIGKVVGSDEIVEMLSSEIFGFSYDEFFKFQEQDGQGNIIPYRIRMKVSITPSDEPVFRNVNRRIRLIEVVGREPVEQEVIIYKDSYEEYV